jgi:hypothetical protein
MWGREDYVRDRLGDAFDLTIERRISRHEEESTEVAWERFSTSFGPTKMLLDNLEPERRDEFEQKVIGLMQRRTQPDGRFVDEREYLLVTGTRG